MCSGELSAIENPSRREENEINYGFLFPADDSDSHMVGQAVCGWREDGVDDGEDDDGSSRRDMEKQLNEKKSRMEEEALEKRLCEEG